MKQLKMFIGLLPSAELYPGGQVNAVVETNDSEQGIFNRAIDAEANHGDTADDDDAGDYVLRFPFHESLLSINRINQLNTS